MWNTNFTKKKGARLLEVSCFIHSKEMTRTMYFIDIDRHVWSKALAYTIEEISIIT